MNARTVPAALGMVFGLAMAFVPANLMQPSLAKPQTEQLPAVVEETIGKKVFEVSRMVVKARPERIWQILSDYANAPSVFENLKKCEVLEDRGNIKIVKHVIHPSGWPGTFEYTLEIKENGPRAMEWHRLRGAFREVDGFWKLEPVEGGRATLVTYSTYVNGGIFLPAPAIRAQIRGDMPAVMVALKSNSESALTQIAAHTSHIHNN